MSTAPAAATTIARCQAEGEEGRREGQGQGGSQARVAEEPAKGPVEKASAKPKPAKPLKDEPAPAKAPQAKAEAKAEAEAAPPRSPAKKPAKKA